MKDEEIYTQKEPQNRPEKTTQSTPARMRTRNSNTNENIEAHSRENNTAVETEIIAGAETPVNDAEKPVKYYGNNGVISPNNHPPFKSYAECKTPEEVERVREERRKGGINSGIVRRANGSIRAAVKRYLQECGDESGLTRADAVGKRLISIATVGEDKNAVKAADLITDLIGERVQQVDLNANVRTVANWRQRPPKPTENGDNSSNTADPMP